MLLCIQHETKLTYSEPVSETVFDVRMAPPSDEDQTNLGYRLRIVPSAPVTIHRDGFGNRVDLFNILGAYSELIIRATSIVRTHRGPAPESRLAGLEWEKDPDQFRALETLEYLLASPLVKPSPELDAFLRGLPRPEGRLIDVLDQLTATVRSHLVYEKKVTTARTPVGEALQLGRGVCQDFAHLFLAACRGIGLPARYVSGYIHHPGELATHAWCQVWSGRSGWVDVDPTVGTIVGDDYVKIAVGRDYSDVPPNRGVWKAVPTRPSPSASRSSPSSTCRPTGATGRPSKHLGRPPRGSNRSPACSASSSTRRQATGNSKASSSSFSRP
ncbi:MAG: transglutaminase domain-containing protein [Isosphaerales bacterium]